MRLGRIVEMELLNSHERHQAVKNQELSCCQGADHDAPWSKTSGAKLHEASLFGNVCQAGEHSTISSCTLLVDLWKEWVCRVWNDGCSHSSNEARSDGNAHLGSAAHVLSFGRQGTVNGNLCAALNCKLCHGVGDLLEQNWNKASVPAHDPLSGDQLLHGGKGALGKGWVRHLTNSGCFQGAQEDIRDELRASRSTKHDRCLHVPSLLITQRLGEVDLEKLIATELEPALDKVACRGGSQAGGQHSSTFFCHDLPANTQQTTLIFDRVQLDAGLHNIHRAQSTMCDGAANASTQSTIEVVLRIILCPVVNRHLGEGRETTSTVWSITLQIAWERSSGVRQWDRQLQGSRDTWDAPSPGSSYAMLTSYIAWKCMFSAGWWVVTFASARWAAWVKSEKNAAFQLFQAFQQSEADIFPISSFTEILKTTKCLSIRNISIWIILLVVSLDEMICNY